MTVNRPSDPVSAPFSGLVGMSQVDVTPPVGIFARCWGAAEHETAEGVHRPFFATVLALRQSAAEPPLVLIGLDAPWFGDARQELQLRGSILAALALDESRCILNLSHTHAGMNGQIPVPERPGGELVEPYLAQLGTSLVEACRRALAEAEPGMVEWTEGWCGLARNRDLPDPDAPPEAPRRVCGWNPSETADGTVLVGRVSSAEGALLGIVVNYACHPTTLAWENRVLSPDYVGAMREIVESTTKTPCLFLQGASGELAPRDQYTGDTAIADRNGRQLGYAVLSALENLPPAGSVLTYHGVLESGAPLALWRATPGPVDFTLESRVIRVNLELRPMKSLADIQSEFEAETDPVLKERLRRQAGLRAALGDGEFCPLPFWCWRIGGAVLTAGPHEAYSILQVSLRSAFAPRPVVVTNLSNGSLGYLPPAELYNEDIYQVARSPFVAGSLEKLIDAAKRELAVLLAAP